MANLSDPCYNYTVLDNSWRSTSNTDVSVRRCDRDLTWSGWYRLFINGLSAHLPDTCVASSRCGTNFPLWITDGHPTVEDGVVTRGVCGNSGTYCYYYESYPIQVKACPGNYYVYELVTPTTCNAAYCADVGSINIYSTTVKPATIFTVYPSVDPCHTYTVLDNPWRATNNINDPVRRCDRDLTWSGWYRLFINGLNAQIPDTLVVYYSCGTDIALRIRGGHPAVEDGIVTRDVCGHWDYYHCYIRSYPIKIKACPDNYYELVSPAHCQSAYCAVVTNISSTTTTVTPKTSSAANLSDPCYNYTVLDNSWRSTSNTNVSVRRCDRDLTWSGWYRFFINGLSAHLPDTCVASSRCGTNFPLWITDGHPTVEDGVVTRGVCGNSGTYCYYYESYPIQVKACPGNYYVYELVTPTTCNAAYCAVYPSVDPCHTYTVLDNPWRATNNINDPVRRCDRDLTWSGWYRLFINGLNAQIPDTLVVYYSCGTDIALRIRGGHPAVEDGIVTRDVCGHWDYYHCYIRSYPIKIKACPDNYYVYELVSPAHCQSAYCAVVTNISSTTTTVTPKTTSAVINITLPEGCTSQTSGGCFQNLLEQIENITAQVLPLNTVTNILNVAFNTSEKILESPSSANPTQLASYGNRVLKTSEKLISTLVRPTDTSESVNFTLPAVEGQVFMVGPQVTLDKIPRLDTTNSSVDIDLIGIAKNNNETRSAAVAFMSYSTMENLLKPNFFNTSNGMIKTMMSTVISATLPKTTNTTLTKPVNFTLKHIREFDPNGSLSCVYWNISEWIVDGCSALETNSSYTVCSCVHLSTFALIMQTSRPPESDSQLDLLNLVCVIVGLVFFSLALLTFALCQWSPGVNNVARINICISLLLAHLLFLLTQQFLSVIRPQQVLCAVISGLLHFLFLSGFVWMFIEAVMLFICVKNLSQISSKKREVLSSGFMCVIGYLVALVVVCVSVGLVPEGYGSEQIMVFKTLAQCVVLGCPWILGFFSNGSKVLEILFLILNSQQGTFIFLIYCVLNDEKVTFAMTRLQAAPALILLHRRMLYSSARAVSALSTAMGQITRHSSASDHSEPCNRTPERTKGK
ncbi:hypothetical protein QQF64_000086 [Cirrhinus molitorella]|uniref:Uncharacterized protein n=1 Tax=Cirrhinus molitorella TaxID=172907 RepID=A0ABR3NW59_9TELE